MATTSSTDPDEQHQTLGPLVLRVYNDKIRTESYRKAIHEKLTSSRSTILCVSPGIGLTPLFCVKRKPLSVAAIAFSRPVYEVCHDVFARNHDHLELLLIERNIYECEAEDVGGKRQLVIFDDFDSTIIGNYLLQMMLHVHEKLLSINGLLLPMYATIYGCGISCKYLDAKHRLSQKACEILNYNGCPVFGKLDDCYDNIDSPLHRNLKIVTTPSQIVKFDFNDIDDIRNKLNPKQKIDVSFIVSEPGEMNAILTWFDLHITEKIMITTDPSKNDRTRAWPQALFYNFQPKIVTTSEKIDFQFDTEGGNLCLINTDPIGIELVSPDIIRYLNDDKLMEAIEVCIPNLKKKFAEKAYNKILDLAPFPLYGLFLMKNTEPGAVRLTCIARTETDMAFIERVFRMNGIDTSYIHTIPEEHLHAKHMKGRNYDLIYSHYLFVNGDVKLNILEIQDAKDEILAPGGIVLPHKLNLVAQVVKSQWLYKTNNIDDKNMLKFKVAEIATEFRPWRVAGVDLYVTPHDGLSKVVVITDVGSGSYPDQVRVELTKDGEVAGIAAWFEMQLQAGGPKVSTYKGDSFVDGILFLADPYERIYTRKGITALIKIVGNVDGSFRLMLDDDILPPHLRV